MLYSYKQQTPNILPNRIRLSSGLTRTDSTTFTDEELLDAGYIKAELPPIYDPNTQHLIWAGTNWQVIDFTEQELVARSALEWDNIRAKRDKEIQSVEWRVSRSLSQERLGLPISDNIGKLDAYVQALRDLTKQTDPYNIIWPTLEL